ncbi:MAG: 4Fe-4S binding protein, partial [Acidobacteria bacterium]|nr:4Fe-4S binding protein [Acidobacteriota bacterium]
IAPRYIPGACTMCGLCVKACPSERADEFNLGLSHTKAVYLPNNMAFPAAYAIDRAACVEGCDACAKACTYGAVDLNQQTEHKTLQVAAVIAATGWEPYDASKIDNLGFGKYKNVVTNVMLERMAAPDGPAAGKIVRPSDGKAPASVIFVQCAGSRDEKHLPYCSTVCCAASLKQATYIRALYPEAKITIFYIDIRTLGRLEDFRARVAADDKIEFVKGKAGKVAEDAAGDLVVTAEDVLHGKMISRTADMVVLATGMVPRTKGLPDGFELDEFGFVNGPPEKKGLYGAGCVRRPEEVSAAVQDATGAALKALQCVVKGAHHA